jgi:Amino acid permease
VLCEPAQIKRLCLRILIKGGDAGTQNHSLYRISSSVQMIARPGSSANNYQFFTRSGSDPKFWVFNARSPRVNVGFFNRCKLHVERTKLNVRSEAWKAAPHDQVSGDVPACRPSGNDRVVARIYCRVRPLLRIARCTSQVSDAFPRDYNGAYGMALTSGTKPGPYEIQSALAAGRRSSRRHRLSGDGVPGGKGPRLPQDSGRPLTMNDSSGSPINASPTNGLRRELGRWDLALLFVVAVLNLNTVSSIATNGPVALWLWLAALLCFFLPQGIAVIELSHRYPGEGGLYLWSKEVFGDFHGFIDGWAYLTTNVFYIPFVLLYLLVIAMENATEMISAAKPNRKKGWCASMLVAVAAASPCTTSLPRT